MPRPAAIPTVQIDNEQVKVTEWRFPPGGETGWHRHAMYYVVVPQTTGALLLETPAGPVTSQLTAGVSYARPVGVEHNVINPGSTEFVFVEIAHQTAGKPVLSRCRSVQAADQIHQRRFSRARRTHDRDIFAALDFNIDAAQRVHLLRAHFVYLREFLGPNRHALIDQILAKRIGSHSLGRHTSAPST
jgi:quercetin dioxygenase-like cupin family protein